MKVYVIYELAAGTPLAKLTLPNTGNIDDHLQAGQGYIEGPFDPRTQTIDISSGSPVVVAKPPPPGPTPKEIADENERTALAEHVIYSATPAQIDNWIDNNVVDLESAKTVLKLAVKLAVLGVRR